MKFFMYKQVKMVSFYDDLKNNIDVDNNDNDDEYNKNGDEYNNNEEDYLSYIFTR